MKTVTLFALLLLLAAPVHAACVLDQFTPVPVNGICSVDGIRSWTQNGVTISYACNQWTIDKDNDGTTFDCGATDDYVGYLGWDGFFANEPSATYALRMPSAPQTCGTTEIYFSPAVKQATLRYAGSHQPWTYNCTGGELCPPGWTCTCISDGALPMTFEFYKNYTTSGLVGTVIGDEEGAGGAGDPTGYLTTWGTATFAHPDGFNRLRLQFPSGQYSGSHIAPFFIDDLQVCTELPGCPNPPCGFESAQRARSETPTAAPRTSWGKIKSIYR